jgi:16S rRNA (cytosine1402-N4)-methyltransferase
MRMDRRRPVTAATILNRASEQELTRIFRDFGEEPGARRLARAVVQRREVRPWERTGEFAALAESLISRQSSRGLPPATRPFQALRLAVNSEQEELAQGLRSAVSLLRPGGRLVVISFHSLEDRLVKQFLREQAAPCVCPPKLPVCACGRRATLQILTRKPLQPTAAEVAGNARSASAKLRAAEKLVSAPAAARR